MGPGGSTSGPFRRGEEPSTQTSRRFPAHLVPGGSRLPPSPRKNRDTPSLASIVPTLTSNKRMGTGYAFRTRMAVGGHVQRRGGRGVCRTGPRAPGGQRDDPRLESFPSPGRPVTGWETRRRLLSPLMCWYGEVESERVPASDEVCGLTSK